MFSAAGTSRREKTLNVLFPEKATHRRRMNKGVGCGLSKNPAGK
jgi:hypothetical protein